MENIDNKLSEMQDEIDFLKKNLDFYKTLIDSSVVWQKLMKPSGELLYCTPFCKNISGYEANEFIENPDLFIQIIHPDDRELYLSHLNKKKQGIEAENILEFRIITKDGKEKWLEHICSKHYISIDEFIGYLSINRDITERKQAEENLRESEENLFITLNSIGDGVIATDNNGIITSMNPAAEKLCGWKTEEAKGKPIEEVFRIVNAQTRMTVVNPVKKVIEKGIIVGLANHTVLISKDGKEYQIADSAAPIKNKEGKIIGVVFSFVDVTEKYENEKKLSENEKKYRLLVDEMNQGVAVHEAIYDENGNMVDYRFLDMNKSYERILGIKKEDWIGKTLLEILPKTEKYWIDTYGQVVKTRKPIEFENYAREFDRYYHVVAYNNQPNQFAVIVTDITERKIAEEERALLSEIIKNNLNEIYLLDADTLKFEFVNYGAINNLGYSIDELKNMTPIDIKPEYNLDSFRSLLEKVNDDNKMIVFETIHKRKDGTTYPVAVHLQKNTHSNKKFFFEIITDITERKQAEEELKIAKAKAEESDRLKTAFLQNMSHEIRTPLNGILGFSNLLRRNNLGAKEIKEYTEIISQSGQRLMEIVNNVLDIAKIETGQMEIRDNTFSLNSMIDDLYSFFSQFATDKNIKLNYKTPLDNSDIQIVADEAKLNQILTNLINNAIKFTQNGSIDFSYEIANNEIQFYVKDTGIGIAPEFQDKIFERFVQVDLNITRGFEGAGLGLAICKGLVEKLGGKIWFESEVNKGSTFFFTIPYKPEISETKTEDEAKDETFSGKKIKTLIAEDDLVSYLYLSKLLKDSRFQLIHAENGREAVEFVKNTPDIDLVLMDMRMPEMDGFEATQQIKAIRPELPIIAQTAYAFQDEREKILSIGCDDYLSKPVEQGKLLQLIKKYI